MASNIEKYKNELKKLISMGNKLLLNLLVTLVPDCAPKYKKVKTPLFSEDYQTWYSESLEVIRQLLPNRLDDFVKPYKATSNRKTINHSNYTIYDYLIGSVSSTVDGTSAISKFEQQLNILRSAEKRFESSLYDIKHLVEADVFDSELDSAKELNKKGFVRAGGAIAGVVLEKHLREICATHQITVKRKQSTINDFNELLKSKSVIDTKTWRNIQLLGDIRNLCDHKKENDPKKEDVNDLINGVEKIIKSVF